MIIRHNHNPYSVLADIFALVLMSALMMVAMLILVAHNATVKHEGVKPDAQYMVILSWADKLNVDLDLWMETPDHQTIYYGNREATNISLDRDSRGYLTNRTLRPDGTVVISPNQEVISIRAIIPGEYLAAVGYYAGEGNPEVQYKVQVIKLNPTYTVLFNKDFTIKKINDAANVVDFTINPDGSVSFNMLPDQNLIRMKAGDHP